MICQYNYVMNNPLRYIDPLGLDTIDITGVKKYTGEVGCVDLHTSQGACVLIHNITHFNPQVSIKFGYRF